MANDGFYMTRETYARFQADNLQAQMMGVYDSEREAALAAQSAPYTPPAEPQPAEDPAAPYMAIYDQAVAEAAPVQAAPAPRPTSVAPGTYADSPTSFEGAPRQVRSVTPTTTEISGGGRADGTSDTLSRLSGYASRYGDEARKALAAVLVTEGGMTGAVGDTDRSTIGSHGPLQFYGSGGQLNNFAAAHGISINEAARRVKADPDYAVQWALDPSLPVGGYMANAIQRGLQAGLSGADLATYIQRTGQVSEKPERAGANYTALFGGGQNPLGAAASIATGAARTVASTAQSAASDLMGVYEQAKSAAGTKKDEVGASVGSLMQTYATALEEAMKAPTVDKGQRLNARVDLTKDENLPQGAETNPLAFVSAVNAGRRAVSGPSPIETMLEDDASYLGRQTPEQIAEATSFAGGLRSKMGRPGEPTEAEIANAAKGQDLGFGVAGMVGNVTPTKGPTGPTRIFGPRGEVLSEVGHKADAPVGESLTRVRLQGSGVWDLSDMPDEMARGIIAKHEAYRATRQTVSDAEVADIARTLGKDPDALAREMVSRSGGQDTAEFLAVRAARADNLRQVSRLEQQLEGNLDDVERAAMGADLARRKEYEAMYFLATELGGSEAGRVLRSLGRAIDSSTARAMVLQWEEVQRVSDEVRKGIARATRTGKIDDATRQKAEVLRETLGREAAGASTPPMGAKAQRTEARAVADVARQTIRNEERLQKDEAARAIESIDRILTTNAGQDVRQMAAAALEDIARTSLVAKKVADSYRGQLNRQSVRGLLTAAQKGESKEARDFYLTRLQQEFSRVDWTDPRAAQQFAAKMAKPTNWDKAHAYRVASILSGPPSLALQTVGVAIETLMAPVSRAVAAGADAVRPLSGSPRRASIRPVTGEVQGMVEGIGPALHDFATTMKTGVSARPIRELKAYGTDIIPGGNKNPLNYVLRFFGANDDAGRTLNMRMAQRAAAETEAARTGKSVDEILTNLVEHPQVVEAADALAQQRTYTERLTGIFQQLQQMRGNEAVRQVVPFFSTLANILQTGLRRTPKGFADAGRLARSGKIDQASVVRGEAIIGTTLMTVGFADGLSGSATAYGPRDDAERRDWSDQGGGMFSKKVGDRWVNYLAFTGAWGIPYALGVLAGEAAREAGRDPTATSTIQKAAQLAAGLGVNGFNLLTNLSGLRGLGDLMLAGVRPDQYGQRFLESYASSYVPATGLLASAERGIDPTVRDPETLVDYLKSRIPFASSDLPAVPTQTGRLREGVGGAEAFLSPIRSTVDKPDPVLQEYQRLRSKGYQVSLGTAGDAVFGVPLDTREQREHQRVTGEELARELGRLIATERYQRLPDLEKVRELEAYETAYRRSAAGKTYQSLDPAAVQERRAAEQNRGVPVSR